MAAKNFTENDKKWFLENSAAGQNGQVLCVGCNQAKKANTFVPDGKGFAYSRIDDDLNPDNRYQGPPKIASARYR